MGFYEANMGFGISLSTILAIKERTDRLPDQPADNVVLLAVKAQTDKLAGLTPVHDVVIDNWNSGVATSGQPGADLVTIGAVNTRYKVHGLHVDISALTPGASITVRLYTTTTGAGLINGYAQTFVAGTDPNDLWIINGTLEIDNLLRVEVYSNNPADDGLGVGYKADLEAM
jgi:hypothetical protein